VETLKIIPHYTGKKDLKEILEDRKSLSMLWLEILLNDSLDWHGYLDTEEIKIAYEKSCIWYGHFRNVIESSIKRRPLEKKEGKIDDRELRKFLEALNFVSTRS